jgi:hypothetical protein
MFYVFFESETIIVDVPQIENMSVYNGFRN